MSEFDGIYLVQVSKALLGEYVAAKKKNKPFKELGLEHMNKPSPIIPSQLSPSTVRSSQFQVHIKLSLQIYYLNNEAFRSYNCSSVTE